MKAALDPKQEAKLIALYRAGYYIAALKERFGVTQAFIYALLERENVALRGAPVSFAHADMQ